MQGIRPTMEDSILIKDHTPLIVDKYTFKLIAVFDGHADSKAAEYCAVNFHQVLEDELKRTLTRRMRMIRRESKKMTKQKGVTSPSRQRAESDKAPIIEKPSTPSKKRAQSVLGTKPSASEPSTPTKSKKSKKGKKTSESSSSTAKVEESSSSTTTPDPASPTVETAATATPGADGALTLDLDQVVPQAIKNAMDRMRESIFDKEIKSGCTAAFVLMFGDKMWFVSCGDARAVISVKQEAKYALLTRPAPLFRQILFDYFNFLGEEQGIIKP
jgi:serine/threonine protein phosphatase PrpC